MLLGRRRINKILEQLSVHAPPRPVRHETQSVFREPYPASGERTGQIDKMRSVEEAHNSTIGVDG